MEWIAIAVLIVIGVVWWLVHDLDATATEIEQEKEKRNE